MRIEIKPPSPAPSPPLRAGALITVRVEASDPVPRLAGPPSVAYEGRYTTDPAPAFLFPAPGERGVSTATSAASDFRAPLAPPRHPYVDVDAHEGDVVTATLVTPPPDSKTYAAAHRVGNPPSPRPVTLQLAEGGAATPQPPAPTPADGLTITPLQPPDLPAPLEQGDVVRLDTAPGADNLVVLVPAP